MGGTGYHRIAGCLTAFVTLLALSACNGGSSGATPFAGINQTYVVAGGNRELKLSGLSGTYTAITLSGEQSLPVSLGPADASVGARSFPYLALGKLLTGGGYLGFALGSVVSDPKTVSGTYTTITGANFAGELSIESSGSYTWCMRSRMSAGGGCADGSAPNSGTTTIVPQPGFKFSGVLGTYAIYQQGSRAAIFSVDSQSLRLMALTEPADSPIGVFSQPPGDAKANPPLITIGFTRNSMVVSGEPNWNGTYDYTLTSGVISFPAALCPNHTCNAIYNNDLGILYVPRLGNGSFIR
jgi:hypothetical protein